MCFFITIAVQARAAERVPAARKGDGLSIEPTQNPSALEAAGAGRVPLLVTFGGCSCGLYTRPATLNADLKAAKARARYERHGWSRAKIDRALASMRRVPREGDGLHPLFLDVIRQIVHVHGNAAFWVHDFTGKVETEPYAITRRERWTMENLADRARTLETDVLIEVTRECDASTQTPDL